VPHHARQSGRRCGGRAGRAGERQPRLVPSARVAWPANVNPRLVPGARGQTGERQLRLGREAGAPARVCISSHSCRRRRSLRRCAPPRCISSHSCRLWRSLRRCAPPRCISSHSRCGRRSVLRNAPRGVGFATLERRAANVAAKPTCGVGFATLERRAAIVAAKPTRAEPAFRRTRAIRADECDVPPLRAATLSHFRPRHPTIATKRWLPSLSTQRQLTFIPRQRR
jgi:hypothetical protein